MDISEVNHSLFRWVNDLGKEFPFLNPTFVFIAEHMVVLLALSVLVYWFTRDKNNRMMILCASIAFICAFAIGKISGVFYSNYQPFYELNDVNTLVHKEKDNSFPSDHTILFFTYCFTFWLFKRGWSMLWVLLAVLVGISRIWVGVHYPLDVFTGILISLASATFIFVIAPKRSVTQSIIQLYEKYESKFLFSRTMKNKSKNV
ncbi:undecaprenyl-diphosphatase [Paenibacillus agilis]|uniref:Undecaprenyl-diphosphatase n=1 Tax=Paenibacillus agilis TaxID=3020863 RepID=A0A559IW28_9BACL|nr:undecaprenyl-diphosphatase [Paenibacillus agilis]